MGFSIFNALVFILLHFSYPGRISIKLIEWLLRVPENSDSDDAIGTVYLFGELIFLHYMVKNRDKIDTVTIAEIASISFGSSSPFELEDRSFRDMLVIRALHVLSKRYTVDDFQGVSWETSAVFNYTDLIEDTTDKVSGLLILASAFSMISKADLADEAIRRLKQIEDKKYVVEGLLKYASILSLLGRPQEAQIIFNDVVPMWNESTEQSMTPRVVSKKANDKGPRHKPVADSVENDGIDFPRHQLGQYFGYLLVGDHYTEAQKTFEQLSGRIRRYMLYDMIFAEPDYDFEQGDYSAEEFEAINRVVGLIRNALNNVLRLIDERIDLFIEDPDDDDFATLIQQLIDNSHLDAAKKFMPHIKKETLRDSLTPLFDTERSESDRELVPDIEKEALHGSLTQSSDDEIPDQSEEEDGEGVGKWSQPIYFYEAPKEGEVLLQNNQLQEAADVARKMSNPSERADLLRKVALQMARERLPTAETIFDEAIRSARAASTKSSSKPSGYTLRELVTSATITQTQEVLNTVALMDMSQPDRERYTIICGVVLGLVAKNQLGDAMKLIDFIRVDPWRTDALVALIHGHGKNAKLDEADTLFSLAYGKISQFRVLCAMGQYTIEGNSPKAEETISKINRLKQSFNRDLHLAWATREYAIVLLKTEHPTAETTLLEAIEITEQLSDMLTRFYGFVDLLDHLLELKHPAANQIFTRTSQIITEVKEGPIYLPELDYPKMVLKDIEQSAQTLWSTVAVETPVWEISALLHLAKILAKHDMVSEYMAVVEKAQEHFQTTANLPWSMDSDFAAIMESNKLKYVFDQLGSQPLPAVMKTMISLKPILRELSIDLSETISEDMLRIFQWVQYNPADITFLLARHTRSQPEH